MVFDLKLCLYTANWIEYYTHVLRTQMGNFGVTEAELISAVIQIITFFKGQDFWSLKNREWVPDFIQNTFKDFQFF